MLDHGNGNASYARIVRMTPIMRPISAGLRLGRVSSTSSHAQRSRQTTKLSAIIKGSDTTDARAVTNVSALSVPRVETPRSI